MPTGKVCNKIGGKLVGYVHKQNISCLQKIRIFPRETGKQKVAPSAYN